MLRIWTDYEAGETCMDCGACLVKVRISHDSPVYQGAITGIALQHADCVVTEPHFMDRVAEAVIDWKVARGTLVR